MNLLQVVLALMTQMHVSAVKEITHDANVHVPAPHYFEPAAAAIAKAVEKEEPLFEGDEDRHFTAAHIVVFAWHESRFRNGSIGDLGRARKSHCMMQIMASDAAGARLRADPVACVRAAISLLRTSAKFCDKLPVEERFAAYAGGNCAAGKSIARARYRRAEKLLSLLPEQKQGGAVSATTDTPVTSATPAEPAPPALPVRSAKAEER